MEQNNLKLDELRNYVRQTDERELNRRLREWVLTGGTANFVASHSNQADGMWK